MGRKKGGTPQGAKIQGQNQYQYWTNMNSLKSFIHLLQVGLKFQGKLLDIRQMHLSDKVANEVGDGVMGVTYGTTAIFFCTIYRVGCEGMTSSLSCCGG
jgi:hypothetical protein